MGAGRAAGWWHKKEITRQCSKRNAFTHPHNLTPSPPKKNNHDALWRAQPARRPRTPLRAPPSCLVILPCVSSHRLIIQVLITLLIPIIVFNTTNIIICIVIIVVVVAVVVIVVAIIIVRLVNLLLTTAWTVLR